MKTKDFLAYFLLLTIISGFLHFLGFQLLPVIVFMIGFIKLIYNLNKNQTSSEEQISVEVDKNIAIKPQEISIEENEDIAIKPQEISFIYKDANGNLSERTVKPILIDDAYIQGFCHSRQDIRTFRTDRIIGNITMNSKGYSVHYWLMLHSQNQHSPVPSQRETKEEFPRNNLEICFTGFKKENKKILETLAINHGLTVRASVSKNLNFLVLGANAGPRKIEQGQEVNAIFLSENEFLEMIETGEIPQ